MSIFSSDHYQEVVVHDLRTPLNVIQLALRMLEESPCTRDPEAAEDLSMIRANAQELERMLVHMVDFSRIPETAAGLAPERFDPRHLLEEVAAEVQTRNGATISLRTDAAPGEVFLDQSRARMALHKAMLNAVAASMGTEIRVTMEARGDRCVTSIVVEVPPRDSVYSHQVDPDNFERLLGTAAERRGLDLAIASRVSTLFGGSATLESNRGQGTCLTIDWPQTSEPRMR